MLATTDGAPSEAVPAGVPLVWSWVQQGDADPGPLVPPPNHTQINYWGAVFRTTDNATPDNTHVEIRDCSYWVLRDGSTNWEQVQGAPLGGASFTPTYFSGTGSPELEHTSDGVNVVPNTDEIWHYWPSSGQVYHQGNVQDMVVNCRARLGLKDPNGVDDRAQAGYLIHVGADWRNPNDISCSQQDYICPGVGVSKFFLVTNDWKNMTMHTVSQQDLDNQSVPLPPASIFGM